MGCCANYDFTLNSSFMNSLDNISYSNTDEDSLNSYSNTNYSCFNGDGVTKLITGKKRIKEFFNFLQNYF